MDLERGFGARLKTNTTCAKLQTASVFPCDSITTYKKGHLSTPGPLNKSMKAAHSASTKRCPGSCEKTYLIYGTEEHKLRIQMAMEMPKTLGWSHNST